MLLFLYLNCSCLLVVYLNISFTSQVVCLIRELTYYNGRGGGGVPGGAVG
jgi:hypothetical protein